MRRISLFEIAGAVERTGFSLITSRTLLLDARCGCPIGLVAFATPGNTMRFIGVTGVFDDAVAVVGLSPSYASGFACGFDGKKPLSPEVQSYALGFNDGRGARILLDVA